MENTYLNQYMCTDAHESTIHNSQKVEINKLRYTMEYFSDIKLNEISTHFISWKNLKNYTKQMKPDTLGLM